MNPKYQKSMLADAAIREKVKKELSGRQWEMKIHSVNLDKNFCLLSHKDFIEKIYCPEFRISGDKPEAGATCIVTVDIAENNGAFNFRAKTCCVQTDNQKKNSHPQEGPIQNQQRNKFQKSGQDYRKPFTSPNKSTQSNPDDFYHTREDFFKASRMGRDEALLAIYLNRAVTNLCTSCGIPPQDEFKPKKFAGKIQNLDFETLKKLAHFLFFFAVENPAGYLKDDQNDSDNSSDEKEKNLREICSAYAKKLISLRDFFSHTKCQLTTELRLEDADDASENADPQHNGDRRKHIFSKFIGDLNREISSNIKHDVHALANFPLTRRIVKKEGKKYVSYYELTKYGIVFLCCMALYKDEADRFCAQLTGLKKNDMFSDSMREYFTATSFPPHRQVLEQGKPEILMFADIINYLNKVPSVCLENLSLQSERKRLDTLKNESLKDDRKKESRYLLHERMGDKFATYALDYLTDFNVLPNFTFRHLDTSDSLNRQRFSFAEFPDGLSPLDRHFIVDHDSVQFEWRVPEPQEHFGKIHIQALRGMMTDNMLKEILYLALDPAGLKLGPQINAQLHRWLSAYHRFLEKVLDRADAGLLPLKTGDFLPELQILSGKTQEEICQDLSGSVGNIIGPSLTAFFENQSHISEDDLRTSLQRKVMAVLDQDLALEKRFQHEKLSDSLMIHLVFRFFNLQLENTPWQFRQLPLSEQHRGCLDYEYQTVHALIGKYSFEPKALWKHFQKMSEKREKSKNFCSITGLSDADAGDYCRSRKMLLENSRSLKRTSSLEDLAFAALKECIREERNVLNLLDPVKNPERESLDMKNWLTRYSLKQQKTYNADALFRSVLKINPGEWQNAYNYAEGCNYHDRPLSSSAFIVPQVNLPQNLFSDLLSQPDILPKIRKNPHGVWNPKTDKVDFSFGIRQISLPIRLRDFYDDSTLVQWLKDNSVSQPTMPVCSLRKNNVDKAFRNIRKVFARDKLLVLAALEYWKEYSKYSARLKFANEESDQPADVYDFFSRDIAFPIAGRKIRIRLNDLNKLSFLQLTGSPDILNELFRSLQLDPADNPEFDTLRLEMNRIKDSDIRIQRRFIIEVLDFYDNLPDVPEQIKPEDVSRTEWENGLKYRKVGEALHAAGYAKDRSVDEIAMMIDFRNALLHDKFNLAEKFQPLIEILDKESQKSR